MKVFRKVLRVVAVLVGIVGAFVAWRIGPRNIIGMIRYDQRQEGKLKAGDAAPDVALVSLDGKTPIRLSEHVGGKPSSSSSAATPDRRSAARSSGSRKCRNATDRASTS